MDERRAAIRKCRKSFFLSRKEKKEKKEKEKQSLRLCFEQKQFRTRTPCLLFFHTHTPKRQDGKDKDKDEEYKDKDNQGRINFLPRELLRDHTTSYTQNMTMQVDKTLAASTASTAAHTKLTRLCDAVSEHYYIYLTM